MDFSRVNYDGELDEAESDELRELVGQFETAQEANVAEFETAKEQVQELLGDEEAGFEALFGEVRDFTEAKESLIGEIVEFESFEGSPMSEDDLAAASFTKVREWHAHFAALEGSEEADEVEGEDPEADFEDMGKRAPTHDEEAEEAAFAAKHLGGMAGF